MKTKTNTTEQLELPFEEQSEPPAVAGGLSRGSTQVELATEMTEMHVQPPATAGGSDPTGASVDIDALRAENEQLKTQIRLTQAHRQITGELERAGARSPELLFDAVKGDLQFGDDGEVVNAAAILEKLRSLYPEQFGRFTAVASIDGAAGQSSQPRLTREALSKMKTDEIAALDWADVRRVLSSS